MAPLRSVHYRRRMAKLVRIGLYTLLFLMGYFVPLIIFYNRSGTDTFVDTSRPGEAVISDENFFHCVAERLSYKEEHPARIPYVLIPVTMDYQDIKQLFCNTTAPMTYITFINNGMFLPLRSLLDRLAVELGHYVDKNLFIIHHPENIGYAAAVNEGLRHALSFSVAQVPWVFITNADVRFAPGLIAEFVAQTKEKTEGQLERIRSLDLEVIAEARTLENVPDPRFAFHSNSYPIITASSLPYRIRTMPPQEMKKQFADTYGIFYTDYKEFMATFALSRLAIATVGFFDENYYPAYGEDHDYLWRMAALGYKKYFSERGKYVHYENANLKVDEAARNRGIFKSTVYFIQSMKFGRMNHQPFRLQYRRAKWFPDSVTLYPEIGNKPLPFNGTIPVDMWVLDTERRRFIWEVGENIRCHYDYKPYNMKLLDFAVRSR
ncbi:beta galactofuranosyl transferase [Leishmania mexicana MHOM/GT/2001/U1103]|uniref:Beta galactofuranosyl transferase n=1 Tax=Leishmania mexicana (strain MHOM/GT/2001/U1103) TaxID=929439 RepID=E9AXX9_LEIMU|nr:beta galactofuranosyl transferase [Leishmania mexicana MHOM/GT/2001/U1103]CBZ27568.1 beta galactofuranosyl transferase [Leishmania mexicana MHOM/GT/2001/U1103]